MIASIEIPSLFIGRSSTGSIFNTTPSFSINHARFLNGIASQPGVTGLTYFMANQKIPVNISFLEAFSGSMS